MSETQILQKLTTPTIQSSSLDAHKIISPAGAIKRPPQNQPGAPMGAPPATRPRGGQPMQTTPGNVQISQPPRVAHVTGTSSSQSVKIPGPPPVPPAVAAARAAKQAQADERRDELDATRAENRRLRDALAAHQAKQTT